MDDLISRQDAIDALNEVSEHYTEKGREWHPHVNFMIDAINQLPSAEPETNYTNKELEIFRHGISLSLLSKRSAQHWRYDEDTAKEIEFLERLYNKVAEGARGKTDGSNN